MTTLTRFVSALCSFVGSCGRMSGLEEDKIAAVTKARAGVAVLGCAPGLFM